MSFDFDRVIPREGTASFKYDGRQQFIGRADVIPLWVADMDFAAPEGVVAALGARAADVIHLVLREGLAMTALGVAIGAVLALVAGRYLRPLLFEASPRDPAVFLVVAVSMMAIATAASVLPAWRANRVDPMGALRAE